MGALLIRQLRGLDDCVALATRVNNTRLARQTYAVFWSLRERTAAVCQAETMRFDALEADPAFALIGVYSRGATGNAIWDDVRFVMSQVLTGAL